MSFVLRCEKWNTNFLLSVTSAGDLNDATTAAGSSISNSASSDMANGLVNLIGGDDAESSSSGRGSSLVASSPLRQLEIGKNFGMAVP